MRTGFPAFAVVAVKNYNSPMVVFEELVKIAKILRRECPWDREQTLDSIKPNILEEAYELVEAINEGDVEEEIGDLLLQAVFAAIIAEEEGKLKLERVIERLIKKLIRNHPHVFGGGEKVTKEEVLERWTKRKASPLGLPRNMPALLYTEGVVKRLKRLGKKPEVSLKPESVDDAIRMMFELAVYITDKGLSPEILLLEKVKDFL